MNEGLLIAIAAFVTAVGGVVVGVITARAAAKKGDIEAVVVICDQLQEENGRLRARLEENDKRVATLENENSGLHSRLALAEHKLGLADGRVDALKIELSESHSGLRDRLALAENKVEALEAELDELYAGLRLLVRQVLDAGMQPVWLPARMQVAQILQDGP